MANINLITELRKKTGAGFSDCQKALDASKDSIEEAVVFLRKKGLADINARTGKTASEGSIGYYLHTGGKLGVMVEVNSETDFVARSEDFQAFIKDLALHITAANPQWVSVEDVPADVVAREKDIALNGIDPKKPAVVLEKIVNGRLSKFYKETVLLEQSFVKDPNVVVKDLLGALGGKVKERLVIKRFVRWAVGQ